MKIKIKSDIVRRIDPETKKPYWSRETIEVHKPEEQDRIEAVLDILRGSTTPEEVQKKYDIATVNSILLSTGNCKIINLSEENILWGFKF